MPVSAETLAGVTALLQGRVSVPCVSGAELCGFPVGAGADPPDPSSAGPRAAGAAAVCSPLAADSAVTLQWHGTTAGLD